jgi:sulfatase modifying factor 1
MSARKTNSSVAPPLWELEQHVIHITVEHAGVNLHQVRPDSRLLEDLGIDSLDFVELLMTLEERFNVSIPDDLSEKMFIRQPLTIAVLAEIVHHQWGTGVADRERWLGAPAERVEVSRRPFTQLDGALAVKDWHSGPLHGPLANTDQGFPHWQRRTDGMRCIVIPAGQVELGSTLPEAAEDERPLHEARLDAFLLDAEPVSVAAFARFLNSTVGLDSPLIEVWCGVTAGDRRGSHFQLKRGFRHWLPVAGTAHQPMVLVSWFGAAAYSLWANRLDWREFQDTSRLPTEAQWEYAARGPRSVRFPWGDEPASQAHALTDLHRGRKSYPGVLPLAYVHERLGMSPFGAHHMAGNVWNWCADWYAADFYGQPESRMNNPCHHRATGIRSERGGSWVGPAHLARSSFRRGRPPAAVGRCLGFRCAVPVRECSDLTEGLHSA